MEVESVGHEQKELLKKLDEAYAKEDANHIEDIEYDDEVVHQVLKIRKKSNFLFLIT